MEQPEQNNQINNQEPVSMGTPIGVKPSEQSANVVNANAAQVISVPQAPIGKKKTKHYWWRYLLLFLGGFLTFGVVAVSGAAIAATQVKMSDVEKWSGKTGELFSEEYSKYSVFDIFIKFLNHEVTYSSLEGISKITPIVDNILEEYYGDLGITEEEYAAIAKFEFSQYNTKEFTNTLFGAISLNKLLSPERVGQDLSDAFCLYPTLDGGQGEFTLRNLVNNELYQDDIAYENKNDETTEYIKYVTNNIKVSSVISIKEGDPLYFLKDAKIGNLQATFMASTFGDILGEEKCETGILKTFKDVPIGKFIEDPNEVVNSIQLLDVFNVESIEDPATRRIIESFCYIPGTEEPVTVGWMQDGKNMKLIIDSILLVNVLSIDKEAIQEDILYDLTSGQEGTYYGYKSIQKLLCYNTFTKEEAIEAGHPEWENRPNPNNPRKLSDIQDDKIVEVINNLYVKDVIEIGDDPNPFLAAIKDTRIGDLVDRINSLTVREIIPEKYIKKYVYFDTETEKWVYTDEEIPGTTVVNPDRHSVLVALADCSIVNIGEAVTKLTIKDYISLDGIANPNPILKWVVEKHGDRQINEINDIIQTLPLRYLAEDKYLFPYYNPDTGKYSDTQDEGFIANPDYQRMLAGILRKVKPDHHEPIIDDDYYTFGELADVVKLIKFSDVIDTSGSAILTKMANANLTAEGILYALRNNVTVNDFISDTTSESSYCRWVSADGTKYNNDETCPEGYIKNEQCSLILSSLHRKGQSTTMADLGTLLNEFTLGDILPDASVEGSLLYDVSNIPLPELTSDKISGTIKIENAFGSEIYGGDEKKPQNIKGVWKYMLRESDEPAFDAEHESYSYKYHNYTLKDISKMMDNMKANMQTTTLRALYNDGLISMDAPENLDKTPIGQTKKLGEFTIKELLNLIPVS